MIAQPTFLNKETAGLLIVDVQENLFPTVEHPTEMIRAVSTLLQAAHILKLPVIITEQYPEGLGPTVGALKGIQGDATVFTKRGFSACSEPEILEALQERDQWLVCGLEAHVCVMQTVKEMYLNGLEPVLINDAISSQSIYDFSTAIAEMMKYTRVTSSSSAIFELLETSASIEFKECQALIKAQRIDPPSCCSIG